MSQISLSIELWSKRLFRINLHDRNWSVAPEKERNQTKKLRKMHCLREVSKRMENGGQTGRVRKFSNSREREKKWQSKWEAKTERDRKSSKEFKDLHTIGEM